MLPVRTVSHVPRALVALAALYFVLDLSAGDRGWIEFVVIALVCGAILWNVVQLGRRFHAHGGGHALWHVQRTVLFWIIGLGNTVWARPEDVGGWRTWVGGALLAIAVVDTVALWRRERSILAGTDVTGGNSPEHAADG